MVLNVFTHVTGLEVGGFFNVSDPQVGVNTGEYPGESSTLTFPKIPTTPSGITDRKAARFRRVSSSKESPNILAPEPGSSPRSPVSVHSPLSG